VSENHSFLTDLEAPQRRSVLSFFRNSFFYGLMILLPIVATIWLTEFTIKFVSEPLQSMSGDRLPLIASFLITLLAIAVLGMVARNVVGKHILQFCEDFLQRIPFVSVVYKSSKQIVDGFSMQRRSMMRPVLVEYPRKDAWTIGFVVKERVDMPLPEEQDAANYWCAVFIPTAPNPTSGYFVYVLYSDLRMVSLSAEECVKIVMSIGILSPEKTT
jgi:uncharacterized membrane protein